MGSVREKWLRVGCFLIGYNFIIVKASSELSIKRVIKYTSSLLIVCLLWAFIGSAFTSRYLKGEWYASVIAMVVGVFLVIQIERQVILSSRDNRLLWIFRSMIAISMSLIGTVIIDQILFKEDIDRRKLFTMGEEVDEILPGRAKELRDLIEAIDSTIQAKETERKSITDDIIKTPFIPVYERVVQRDTALNESVTITKRALPNPKVGLIEPIDKTIVSLRSEKSKKDSILLALRTVVEGELRQSTGFLDELRVMYILLSESGIAVVAWLIWFVFLLGLELLILASKIGETENDYDRMMVQQMDLHFKKIELLGKKYEAV